MGQFPVSALIVQVPRLLASDIRLILAAYFCLTGLLRRSLLLAVPTFSQTASLQLDWNQS